MDQRKLDAARRVLGVDTGTEAIDLALDPIAFRRELARGVAAVRRSFTLITKDGGFERLLPFLGRWRHAAPWPSTAAAP